MRGYASGIERYLLRLINTWKLAHARRALALLRRQPLRETNTVNSLENQSKPFAQHAAELSPALKHYLQRYVGNPALAEDLLQETLIRIGKGLAGFEQRSSLKTWAFAIASRVAADHFRSPENSLDIVEIDEAEALPDADPHIEERLVVAEMSSCVREVVDSLPPDYRTALVLHDLEGMSAEQVATVCECSLATAKIRIHRARARLKEKLQTKCDFSRDDDGVFRCDRKG